MEARRGGRERSVSVPDILPVRQILDEGPARQILDEGPARQILDEGPVRAAAGGPGA
jgi:hypothetical protein